MQPSENPFIIGGGNTANPPPPAHFRRHGTAEQGYTGGFGNFGVTPPGSPRRSPAGSPRGTRRARTRAADDEEEPARARE